jgi:uncharacterized damage-inducible protein DinB
MLTGFLDYHRVTMQAHCGGLSDLESRRSMPAPIKTAIGLVTHLRWEEHFWFEVVLAGRENRTPRAETGNDPGITLEQALVEYKRQCATSSQVVAELALDYEVGWHDRAVSVRWVLFRLLEETARHNGQLDAILGLIDQPPG